jgi:predicted anti-sigma-YlaC factor YlaD
VSCEPFRDALSARLDGESPGIDADRLQEHLAGCPSCRAWEQAAAEVTRRARLTPAVPVPDVTAAVLAALPAAPPERTASSRPGRRWVDAALRGGLLAVGAGQLGVALVALTAGTGHAMAGMPTPTHLTHETAAWNLGLAACFLVVAARPRLAAGSLPFLLPFTAVLGWVTVGDLSAGHVHGERAAVHLVLLAGAVLVSLLAVRSRPARGGPVGSQLPHGTADRPATSRSRFHPAAGAVRPVLRAVDPAAGHSAAAPPGVERAA